MPPEYYWTDNNFTTVHKTTVCYFKGKGLRILLTEILIAFYLALVLLEIVWSIVNMKDWKSFKQLVKHLTPFFTGPRGLFIFSIEKNIYPDLENSVFY